MKLKRFIAVLFIAVVCVSFVGIQDVQAQGCKKQPVRNVVRAVMKPLKVVRERKPVRKLLGRVFSGKKGKSYYEVYGTPLTPMLTPAPAPDIIDP